MTRRRRWLAAAMLAAGVVWVTGCGDEDGSSGSVTTVPAPITVEQLTERSADTPIAVEGFLHEVDGLVRLCAAILESYPPQCGEPAVEIVGLDVAALRDVTTVDGVSWKEGAVLTVQRQQDGRFAVVDG